MEEFFIDFNKRKLNRIGYPLVAAILAIDGVFQMMNRASRLHPAIPILEIVYGIVLVIIWVFPPKWYFRVDDSAIEFKRQFAGMHRFDWTAISGVQLLPKKVTIELAAGGSHRITLTFLGEKERLAITDVLSRFAEERNLLRRE